MKRIIDFILSFLALIALSPIFLLICLIVRLDSRGPIIFWSQRFGRNGTLFYMPKFRTMHVDTPNLPTHQLGDARNHVTTFGSFLRKSSLDELPQLYSVLIGHMSLVGPRPALFSQEDLMQMRTRAGIDVFRPGITGWAQINGRDELSLERKVRFEIEYLQRQSVLFDLRILFFTVSKIISGKNVSH